MRTSRQILICYKFTCWMCLLLMPSTGMLSFRTLGVSRSMSTTWQWHPFLDENACRPRRSCSRQRYDYRQSLLLMGKGDGKKKKKPKKAAKNVGTSTPSASASVNPPPRVTSDSNIPVRHQIRWGKMRKAYEKSSGTSFRQKKVIKTRYRRTLDEEEVEVKRLERQRKGQDPDWDVILNQTAARPLVIVDGYNIIYKWARLKKHMVKGNTGRARQLLVDDLESLRSLKGWRIECVFDGAGRSNVGPLGDGPGGSSTGRVNRKDTKDVSKHGVRIVYTGAGVEADTYIEKRCYEAKNVTNGATTRSFIIASDDGMIRLAGQNAGALCMSAGRFVDELKAVKKATEYRVEVAMAQINGNAIRPEKLRGTQTLAPSAFGRNSILFVDKSVQKKRKRDVELAPEDYVNVTAVVDERGIPWWAQTPKRSNGDTR